MMDTLRIQAARLGILVLSSFITLPLFSQSVATLTGTVTNGITGTPVTGAKISIGNDLTYSVIGGTYVLAISQAGTYSVSSSKPGFDNFQSSPITIMPSFAYTMNISLLETPNPPGTVTVHLDNTGPVPLVPVNWQVPQGDYELIYDDGLQDNFTIWELQGNMNAVLFTPVGNPATVTGGRINIGNTGNYPPGSNPFVPFQVSIYDASGPGGKPGSILSGPIVVFPSALGWLEFTLPDPVLVVAGNFYIVMTQGGNTPNAAGLAIDATTGQQRSYSRFVSGGGAWMPASGNYMIRAEMHGPGGPPAMDKKFRLVSEYDVWRLRQGEEMNSSVWIPLGKVAQPHLTDSSWLSLPCGPYRWGVKAHYPGNRQSTVTFSNVLGKCWTNNVSVHVQLSCDSTPVEGTQVILKNLVYPDTVYNKFVDASGNASFPDFWKGTYEFSVSRFGYSTLDQYLSIATDTLLSVFLLQEKNPPSDLEVNDISLFATWRKPQPQREIFTENWNSGNFSANGWTTQGGSNWVVSPGSGNPAPSAMFSWSPQVVNYEQTLTSRNITGQHSQLLKLRYDIFLDDHGTTSMNQMAVEIWDGASWQLLKSYSNATGDIHWTGQVLDISDYTNSIFRIRFRAFGGDSYDINYWDIDNISVIASESPEFSGNCLLGYNFYLDNILCGLTHDTAFQIPSNLVQYGHTYNACVAAVYGSGPSVPSCQEFTSHWLPPPINLQGTSAGSTARITWNKPQVLAKTRSTPPGLIGYRIYRDGLFLDVISNPDTLSYSDTDLFPSTYSYGVSALYDLSSYGFPGRESESLPAGPVSVSISYGAALPFFEPWDGGNFTDNSWTFDPSQGNWHISQEQGNPAPSAEFSGTPGGINYSFSLESKVINTSAIGCSKIWMDFDGMLQDNTSGSSETLTLELFYNTQWNQYLQYSNTGSQGWTSHHIDISAVKGRAFKVRFTASGPNSENIVSWRIDNINIYSVCKPARNLVGDAQGLDVRLSWSPPVCPDGRMLDEGFEASPFPPAYWTQVITNPSATWVHSGVNNPVGVHSGNWAARVAADYSHQDEWLIAKNVEVTGNLEFWSFGFQGSVHQDHYYIKVSKDEGNTWDLLFDLSAMPPYPSVNGYNQWNEPYVVDLSGYLGQVVDIAWQTVDGDGLGAWYTWAVDDCSVGDKKIPESAFSGGNVAYDIYRSESGTGNFTRVNQGPVYDTTFLDPALVPSAYYYFITAETDDCQYHISSDTVVVDVITGVYDTDNSLHIKIFPNPAVNFIYAASNTSIISAELFDFLGRPVNIFYSSSNQSVTIDVANIPSGIYLLKLTTGIGIAGAKVVIEH
jgi:hypothetical protein